MPTTKYACLAEQVTQETCYSRFTRAGTARENEDGVFEIANAGQLYWFADKVNNDNANFGSANAILTADIVVNEGNAEDWGETPPSKKWYPISGFAGKFDGQGHTISGICLIDNDNNDVEYQGLFGVTTTNVHIRDFKLKNSYFKSSFTLALTFVYE